MHWGTFRAALTDSNVYSAVGVRVACMGAISTLHSWRCFLASSTAILRCLSKAMLVAVCSPLVGLTAQSPACWIRGHGRRCLNRLPPGGSGLSQHRCGAAVLPSRWFSEQRRNPTQCTTTAPHLPKTLQHRPIGALRSHRCHEGVSNMNCAVISFQSERAEIYTLYYMFFDYPCATQRRG